MNINKWLWAGLASLILFFTVLVVVWLSSPQETAGLVTQTSNKHPNSQTSFDDTVPAADEASSGARAGSPAIVSGSTHAISPEAPPVSGNNPIASVVGGQTVQYAGTFTKAEVRYGGRTYDLTPNQLGNFQRVDVGTEAKINVQVTYPQGEAGDPVAVEVKDGGTLNKNQMAEVSQLDDQKSVQFLFQTTANEGVYRVLLRNGADVKVLSFWAGPAPELAQ